MSVLRRLPLEAILNAWAAALDPEVKGAVTDIVNYMRERDANLTAILNQGIKLADNVDGSIIEFTTNSGVDTLDTTPHGLERVPTYFILLDINKGGVLYRSAAFDETNFYSKCTVASAAVKVLIL